MSTTTESRISIVTSGQGPTVQVLTDLACCKVGAEQTGGAYSVFKVTVPPGGGPPLHRHPPAESFYVLDGEFALACADGREITVGADDTVHIPADEPHGYRNIGQGMGHMIAIIQPSGLEAFFNELGIPADGATEPTPLTGPPDIERLMAITAKHGVEML
jgi:quercetin dioxygenase-like cupin family protein